MHEASKILPGKQNPTPKATLKFPNCRDIGALNVNPVKVLTNNVSPAEQARNSLYFPT